MRVRSYVKSIAIDEVVRSGGIVEVVRSNSEQYKPGDMLFGFAGWQDYVIASPATGYQSLPEGVYRVEKGSPGPAALVRRGPTAALE